MPLIQIDKNEFINTDHVVRMVYRPEDTRIEEIPDDQASGLPKEVESKADSFITVTLSDGHKIDRDGLAADELYQKLTHEEPPKIRARKLNVDVPSQAGSPPRSDQTDDIS